MIFHIIPFRFVFFIHSVISLGNLLLFFLSAIVLILQEKVSVSSCHRIWDPLCGFKVFSRT